MAPSAVLQDEEARWKRCQEGLQLPAWLRCRAPGQLLGFCACIAHADQVGLPCFCPGLAVMQIVGPTVRHALRQLCSLLVNTSHRNIQAFASLTAWRPSLSMS